MILEFLILIAIIVLIIVASIPKIIKWRRKAFKRKIKRMRRGW